MHVRPPPPTFHPLPPPAATAGDDAAAMHVESALPKASAFLFYEALAELARYLLKVLEGSKSWVNVDGGTYQIEILTPVINGTQRAHGGSEQRRSQLR